ncbi:FAD-dependent oxidoreductase [Rhodococcus sp. WS4]|nr:FAD-dependent oxidoreductase [Rhodococcus sp. WS4]
MPFSDLVVVGAGITGLTAALSAQELGLRVVLIERGDRIPGWSNSAVSSGVLHAAKLDPNTDPSRLAARVFQVTDHTARSDVVQAWADGSAEALAWARDHGAILEPGVGPWHRPGTRTSARPLVLAPQSTFEPGLRADSGIAAFLDRLAQSFIAGGGQTQTRTRAVDLICSDDGVTGVRVENGGRSHSVLDTRMVLLADGGFQAAPELVARHIGTNSVVHRAADTATGDGLRMAHAVGAALSQDMTRFYGHCLHRDAMHEARLRPYPVVDAFAESGIVVNSDGRRVDTNGMDGVGIANAIAHSGDPLGCWAIVDEDISGAILQPDGQSIRRYLGGLGAAVPAAPTLAELTAMTGWDPSEVQAAAATTESLTGPVCAVPLVAGLTFTMGGITVDGNARVLSTTGQPIPGLLAAGSTAGGLHGGPRAGYAGGLLAGLVSGRIAANTAARDTRLPIS